MSNDNTTAGSSSGVTGGSTPAPSTPILKFFSYQHLPEKLQANSKPFHDLAWQLETLLPAGPEKTTAFRKLLEAKDCAVRAMI